MKKCRHYFVIFICLLLLYSTGGCSICRRTITHTERIIDIDTVIIVRTDTIERVGVVPLLDIISGDTLKVESSTSVARTYFNVHTNKIELTLTGKNFAVPVKIQSVVKEKVVERQPKFNIFEKITFIFSFLVILTALGVVWKIMFIKK